MGLGSKRSPGRKAAGGVKRVAKAVNTRRKARVTARRSTTGAVVQKRRLGRA